MWTEPKTDWVSTDYFNYTDYNRIKNNIAYLRELALTIYVDFPFEDMGVDKVSYTEYPYADEFNAMENNLESLRENTFLFDDSDLKEWYENVRTPNYEDFNRLERACFLFKQGLENQKNNKFRLPFRLGNMRSVIGGPVVIRNMYLTTRTGDSLTTNDGDKILARVRE